MGIFGRRSRRAPDTLEAPVEALAAEADAWVWPYWLERQLDPSSPSAVEGTAAFRSHIAGRSWTIVGNLDSPLEAVVDPRGLVTPWTGAWSLDWWIGADDRWHLPSREVAVRQHLLEHAPVVESAMRVPSGDVVQRVYAVRQGGRELVVVEIENRSPVPVALALALRPYGPTGLAPVRHIELVDGLVRVDGRVALLLPKEPSRLAGSDLDGGDVATTVTAGEAGTEPLSVRCPRGAATAALVWPLAHRTSMRFVLPLDPSDDGHGLPAPSSLPSAEQVANGWKLHGERGVRFVLPDERLEAAVAANRRYALLLHDGPAVVDGPAEDAVAMAGALARLDLAGEAAELLVALVDRQQDDGSLGREEDATAAVLLGLAGHLALHPDPVLLDAVTQSVADAAEWLLRRHRRKGGLPADAAALLAAAEVLDAGGEPGAAAAARRAATTMGDGGGVVSTAALGPAAALLAAGDRRALVTLRAVLDAASGTWTWPPSEGRADGHDRRAVADLLTIVRDLLVREVDGGLALLSMVPDTWLGRGVEVHGAPTAHGALSFAIRWHGDRPALLWELERRPGAGPVTITVPGLDPAWSSVEPRGDALLGPVLPPGTPVTLKRS